jgi:septum formation protein
VWSIVITSMIREIGAMSPGGEASHLSVDAERAAEPRLRRHLVLASQSPRRRELLLEHGLEHEAVHPGIDDATLEPTVGVPAEQWVSALAYLKAMAGASACDGDSLVLGADTTCVKVSVDGTEVLGTPRDVKDAERILRRLSDGTHRVVTGVAIVDAATGVREMFTDSATVRVGRLSEEQIEVYLRSGDWKGKAGAYNLRERIAAGWPIEFDGDPGTIMGLPMRLLAPRLRRRLEPL